MIRTKWNLPGAGAFPTCNKIIKPGHYFDTPFEYNPNYLGCMPSFCPHYKACQQKTEERRKKS